MTKTDLLTVAAATALVTACGGAEGDQAADATPAAAPPVTLTPGQYQVVNSVTDVEFEGGATSPTEQAMLGAMRQTMAEGNTETRCFQAADIQAGLPKLISAPADCQARRTTLGGGTVDVAFQCANPNPFANASMSGTHDATSLSATMEATVTDAELPKPVTVKGRIEATRVGDC